MNDIVTVQDADDDAAVGDMTWIEIAVLGGGRGAVVLDYSEGWRPFIEELHVDDVFDEMPLNTPDRAGAYRWTGYKIGSWQEDDAIVLRGGTFAPQSAAEPFLYQLRRVNLARYEAWVEGADAGIMFDALELGGEVGELLSVVKKLEREERGWRGSRANPADFDDECADVMICLDKLARRRNVDLAAATIAKFNATSEKVGLPHRLAGSSADPVAWEPEVGSVAALARANAAAAGGSDIQSAHGAE